MATIYDILRQEFGGGDGISQSIQEQLGAAPQRQDSELQNIFAGRFDTGGPSFADYASAIQQSASGKPTNANDIAQANQLKQLEQMAKLQALQPKQSPFANLVAEYQSIPATDPRKKLYEDKLIKETTVTQMGMPIPVFDPKTGQQTFATREQVIGGGFQPPTAKPKPLPASVLKLQQEGLDKIATASAINADLGAVKGLIDSGKLNLGLFTNLGSQAANYVGASTENSRNYQSFRSTLEKLRNDSLRLNNGVQTEGDSQRAWNELLANINDEEFVKQRLEEIQKINERAVVYQQLNIDNLRAPFDAEPMDYEGYTGQGAALGTEPQTPQQPPIDKRQRLEQLRAKKAGLING